MFIFRFSKIFAFSFGLLLINGPVASQQLIEVCASCQYRTLKSAIAAATAGATIKVKEGVYKENRIQIDKKLSLVAEGKVIVDANGEGHGFILYKTQNVSITGFTIQNTGMSYTEEFSGVRAIESKDCTIASNTFLDTTYAVYLENSEACLVADN
ncbi:MAG TPA: NosD domain-containing protein, partial [Pseudobdellovibrionaceae bacterium]